MSRALSSLVIVMWLAACGSSSSGPVTSAGESFTCALRPDGAVACWGLGAFGQLGDGTRMEHHAPVAVLGLTDAVAIATGARHACALRASGRVVCWGGNASGELGDGTTTDRMAPVAVLALTDAIAIAAGGQNTCALRATGALVCWGANGSGQLGDGTTSPRALRALPVAVHGITDAVALSVGVQSACAVHRGGGVVCWGDNDWGALGDGTTSDRHAPVPVVGLGDVVAVATSGFASCALRRDGSVACWGADGGGDHACGLADTCDRTPRDVPGITDAVALATGIGFQCVTHAGGDVSCWGANENGQLGDGTSASRDVPAHVSGLVDAVSVSGGLAHACAVRTNGSIACWGQNGWGELGNGASRERRVIPVAVVEDVNE